MAKVQRVPPNIADAREVCRRLNVPHYTYDMEQKFKEKS